MASAYKVLGQVAPVSAATETALYTVPAATQAVVSTIAIACIGSGATARINVRPGGAAATNQHALLRDVSLSSGQTQFFTLGLTLAATDVISVQTSVASALAFHVYGTEIS